MPLILSLNGQIHLHQIKLSLMGPSDFSFGKSYCQLEICSSVQSIYKIYVADGGGLFFTDETGTPVESEVSSLLLKAAVAMYLEFFNPPPCEIVASPFYQ